MRNVTVGVLLVLSSGCSSTGVVHKCEMAPSRGGLAMTLPSFVLGELRSDSAQRAKLYFAPDGRLRKATVYVTKEAMPGWVHTAADREIGAGQDKEYEVEVYGDGDQVYEVTRIVGGKEVELSVRTDRSIKYIGRKVEVGTIPEEVAQGAKALGLAVETVQVKEMGQKKEFHLKGKLGSEPYRVVLDEHGGQVLKSRVLDAAVELDR